MLGVGQRGGAGAKETYGQRFTAQSQGVTGSPRRSGGCYNA